ncbi:hypothetical protein G6F60_005231 [Rhizopus arrhizus]|nr:hypothetical protein G6F60_005231 [Rhizopus arrhizus]
MPAISHLLTGAKQLSIDLTEPVVFLKVDANDPSTHVLRGEVSVVLTKPITATQVTIRFTGKCSMVWPEGVGTKISKILHEKVIYEEDLILQSFPEQPKSEGILNPGLHRWPFQFLLSNQLTETIEDVRGKVFYYMIATIHRVGVATTKLRARRDVLLLRTPDWPNDDNNTHSLMTSEHHFNIGDTSINVEKTICSSGTEIPISLSILPKVKHVSIESISVIITEKRVYLLPEFKASRVELSDFKVTLSNATSLFDDPTIVQPSFKDIQRSLSVKNAHISLNEGPLHHRLVFLLPNCYHLNHSTTYSDISIVHTLKINIELSYAGDTRIPIRFETPITILDCRLREDHTLPTYEEALLYNTVVNEEGKPTESFVCPRYLSYKKGKGTQRDRAKPRNETALYHNNSLPPPSYDDL